MIHGDLKWKKENKKLQFQGSCEHCTVGQIPVHLLLVTWIWANWSYTLSSLSNIDFDYDSSHSACKLYAHISVGTQ